MLTYQFEKYLCVYVCLCLCVSLQGADKAAHTHILQLAFQSPQLTQNRASVLRSTSLRPLGLYCGEETFSIITGTFCQYTFILHSLVQSEVVNCLFVNGRCRWPGCDEAFEEYPVFLKHLNHVHSCGEKTIAQWRVQQDRVQHMENQLIQERQRLHAMQLHLRLSEHNSAHPVRKKSVFALTTISSNSQTLFIMKLCAKPSPTVMECYKYVNIRPPYTYAFLIRWSILEAPDKRRALNEIYNWFIRMFFYFRHNTPTWKNAVRHNLSLHKCFVRVDGGKGAVWTVDEREFQKRKGQKFNRDSGLKWLTPYPHSPQVP
uniref:Fork-head domain-containing protein n=1 Tax=Pygocentrus nattereri TaxID=42514 RepID=A0AAR2KB28_PYGNA